MFIRSERLFLRPGWPEDWQDLFDLIDDEAVVRNLAHAPWPYRPEHARQFAAQSQEAMLPHFFVTLPTAEGADMVGLIGLGRDGDDVELGYWIARPFWGQGYATEAVRVVLSQARALGYRRIVASHFADNPASGRVLQKAGFRPAGGVRMRYSAGRGADAPALHYAVSLVPAGGCDDDGEPSMRSRIRAVG
ncbi:MAG: GNAT family N-acetyltransferase [Sphingomonadales bacterium]|nr:GNAT family N-acetyltransferase [Sphingomonadales bacterium]